MLGCAIAAELCERFPQLSEGKLTRLRASLVRSETLAELARELDFAGLVRVGEGELAAGVDARPSILADALEAVVGAVFLDGGYEAAERAVLAIFDARLALLDPERPAKDAKTELQELLQAAHQSLPMYRLLAVEGEAHRQSFEVECSTGEVSATGRGSSRQRAEQEAARAVLERLARR